MSQQPDQHWIDCVLAGDRLAYGMLVNRYKHMVFTLALKIVRNREDAEEVAQDVFLKAYTALKTYKGEARFSTWLYKIAYYRSLDYIKKNQRMPSTVTIDNLTSKVHSETPGSAEGFDERGELIRKAMEQLSRDDQIILTLHYYEDMALNEIATVMGISSNTAKTRIFRGRQRLAGILMELGIEKSHSYEKAQ